MATFLLELFNATIELAHLPGSHCVSTYATSVFAKRAALDFKKPTALALS
jgi:hypothetical protein